MSGKSTARIPEAARTAALANEILAMPASTRTAEEAARACGCNLSPIAKSLVFERQDDETLALLPNIQWHGCRRPASPPRCANGCRRQERLPVRCRAG
jgi:hypothetical protein